MKLWGRLIRAGVLLFVVVVAAGTVYAVRHGTNPGRPSWSKMNSPFTLSLRGGGATLTEAPGIRYTLTDGSVHSLRGLTDTSRSPGGVSRYRVRGDDGRAASVDVRRTSHGLRVSVALAPSTGIKQVTETFAASTNEHFVGGGETGNAVDLRGTSIPVKVSYHCGSIAVPFFFSSRGFGLNVVTSRVGAIGFPGSTGEVCTDPGDVPCVLSTGPQAIQVCVKGASLTYDVYFGNPQQVVRDHALDVGKPRRPPVSQLGLIKWRDVGDQHTVLQDVAEFHRLGIPIGWELIDNPWEAGDCQGRLQFGPPRFPDGRATIDALHASGVDVMLWVSPRVNTGQACAPYPAELLRPDDNGFRVLDLTRPAARARFAAKLAALFRLGVDGFKADRGDDIDLEPVSPTLPNDYPVLFQRAIVDAARSAGVRSFGEMVRAASSASPSLVAGVWGSDQDASWESLATAIRSAQSAGVSGFPIWGSDVGGYSSAKLFDELFVRWAQFGALSPIMEVGGTGRNSTPWTFPGETVDLFRRAVVLHYELAPYLALLQERAVATGDPILQPLGYAQPGEPGSWTSPLELFVGPDLFAAPVDVGGFGNGTAVTIGVYIPAGKWYDLFAGSTATGPASALRSTTLADFPLYARAGALLPFDFRVAGVWRRPWATNSVSTSRRAGWLYAPGHGTSTLSIPGRGSISGSTSGGTVTLRIADAAPETQVFVPVSAGGLSLSVNGKPLARTAQAGLLAGVREGWAVVASPFPGVIVKVAGRAGDIDVELKSRAS